MANQTNRSHIYKKINVKNETFAPIRAFHLFFRVNDWQYWQSNLFLFTFRFTELVVLILSIKSSHFHFETMISCRKIHKIGYLAMKLAHNSN